MMSSHIQQWTLISTVTWEHQLRVTIITETPDIKCCELLRREELRKKEGMKQEILLWQCTAPFCTCILNILGTPSAS